MLMNLEVANEEGAYAVEEEKEGGNTLLLSRKNAKVCKQFLCSLPQFHRIAVCRFSVFQDQAWYRIVKVYAMLIGFDQ